MNDLVIMLSKIAFIFVAGFVLYLGILFLKNYVKERSEDNDFIKKIFIILLATAVIALILANIVMYLIQAILL